MLSNAVTANEKRVLTGKSDINQLAPFKYPWAWEFFLNANKNHWTPLDINMNQDVHDYNHKLTDAERHVYENVLAYLTTSDILAMRNIGIAVMEKMTAPELQIYQARQVYEESNHCYIQGTEYLTPHGWKKFEDYEEGDIVAQYTEEGNIEFVKPLGYTKDPFDGNMIRIASKSGNRYESIVTPNHRCVVMNGRMTKTFIETAENLNLRSIRIPVAGHAIGELKNLTNMDRLQIAYQADGLLQNAHSNNGEGTGYRFHFTKERKVERIEHLLNSLELKYTKTNPSGDNKDFYYYVPKQNLNLSKDFDWVDLSKISSNWCKEFIEEMGHWDGCVKDGDNRFSTTNRSVFDKVTAIVSLSNHRCSTAFKESQILKDGHERSDTYFTNAIDKHFIMGSSLEKTEVPYKGFVYSVGVPSTMLIVRYNNKITVSGNTWSYQHCIESIGFDQQEIYNRYRVIPQIKAKIDFSNEKLRDAMNNVDVDDKDSIRRFVLSYCFFAGIFEGSWFYNGFSPIFSLQRRGLMKGTGEMLQYIMRDEVLHASFGIRVARQIMFEEDITFDDKVINQMFIDAGEIEHEYSKFLLPKPILGYSAEDHFNQYKFVANRRARALGSRTDPFPGAKNALPWLDEQANMRKEKNFFETRVTEYQTGGGLTWDD